MVALPFCNGKLLAEKVREHLGSDRPRVRTSLGLLPTYSLQSGLQICYNQVKTNIRGGSKARRLLGG